MTDFENTVDGNRARDLVLAIETLLGAKPTSMATVACTLGSVIGRIEDCEQVQQTLHAVQMLAIEVHNDDYHADEAEEAKSIH